MAKPSLETLKKIPLFAELDEDTLLDVGQIAELKEFAPGELIYEERSEGDAFYIVDQGRVVVSKVIDWDDMREKTLATLGSGVFFGEMSLLDDEPRSATIRAEGQARLLVIDRASFHMLLQASSLVATKLLLNIVRTVNRRLRQTNTELVTLYDTGKIIGSVRDLTTLADQIMERLVETLLVEKGLLLLENPYSSEIEVAHAVGYSIEDQALFTLRKDMGLLGELWKSRQPIAQEGPLQESLVKAGFETENMLLVPLVNNEVMIGALVLCNTFSGEPFNSDDMNLVQGVASQVATAVENARMVEEREAKDRHERVYITY